MALFTKAFLAFGAKTRNHFRKGVSMRKLATKSIIICLVVVSQIIASSDIISKGQLQERQLPKGNWEFSAHPYTGPGYDSRPVIVTSVLSDAAKSLTITKVRVKNASEKSVSAIKLGWALIKEGESAVLQRGETPLIAMSSSLQPNNRQTVSYPVVNFGKLSKNYISRDILTGSYRIDIIVSEVVFEDETNWIGKNRALNSFVQFASFSTVSTQAGCPKQKCKYVSEGGAHYICETSSDSEFCTNCSSSCIVTLCGENPPDCG